MWQQNAQTQWIAWAVLGQDISIGVGPATFTFQKPEMTSPPPPPHPHPGETSETASPDPVN